MPYTGPNTSIYGIICTYYLQLPVTEIHPLQNKRTLSKYDIRENVVSSNVRRDVSN